MGDPRTIVIDHGRRFFAECGHTPSPDDDGEEGCLLCDREPTRDHTWESEQDRRLHTLRDDGVLS